MYVDSIGIWNTLMFCLFFRCFRAACVKLIFAFQHWGVRVRLAGKSCQELMGHDAVGGTEEYDSPWIMGNTF